MSEVKIESVDDYGKCPSGTAVEKKRRKRSRAGCFTCRLKRKKCDEVHPVCGPCKRNILNCIWPVAGNGKLTQDMREAMKKEVNFYEKSDDNPTEPPLNIIDEFPPNFAETIKTVYPPKNITRVYQNVYKMSHFERSSMPTSSDSKIAPNFSACSQNISFVNYSYDKKHKDFVSLRTGYEEKEPKVKNDHISFELATIPKHKKNNNEDVVNLIEGGKLVPIEALTSATDTNAFSNTDFFWRKMFDVNFYEPLMTPNFSIITPLPLKDGMFSEQSVTPNLITSEEDLECYGLDDEQSEMIYIQLLEKFKQWSSINDEKLLSVANILSKYQFDDNELLLYYTCVHYFFPAIGPQPTLPQLTTTETFLPLIKQHPIVKDVFLCCGATFLEWCQPQKFSSVAEELYQKSQKSLKEHTERGAIKGDETWAFACFQLLCLTDKFRKGSGTSMVDRCVDNLAHSFNIIKKKYRMIKLHGSTATDRMLIESFMYNYTVSLSVASDLSKLPSPFSKNFHDLTKLLKSPIFDGCDVKWINNPILGSSVDAFEMLAKVSYLGRFPLPLENTKWIERAKQLLEECLYYTPPTLPVEVRNNPEKYARYRPSLLCGSIISKACYLLLSKILRFDDFQVSDFEIQGVVKYTVQSLRDVEKGSPLLCILLWSLLIIGAFTIDPQDRLVIKEYIKSTSETIHSYGALKIANLLELIWEHNNINLLFVREHICEVVI